MSRLDTRWRVVVAVLLVALFGLAGCLAVGGPATAEPHPPQVAVATLAKIDDGTWPDSANAPGTKGGDTWQNRERRLPRNDSAGKVISYREWDVNPKRRGETRDAERIITGSDGSAWYTGDHYTSFVRMR